MVAVGHRLNCERRGAEQQYGATRENVTWDKQMFSTGGEMSVAKYLNLYWSGPFGAIKAVDVGGELGVEVRTRAVSWYELTLHDKDADDRPHVLVTADAPPVFRLVGWIYGRDGKLPKFIADPAGGRAAYFVPQMELRPMAELKRILGGPAYVEKGGG
jgi:hypothetical protein